MGIFQVGSGDLIFIVVFSGAAVINRGADKKKVVFLRDISEKMQFSPNEEFTRLWRSVAVTDMDDNKIEEYLYKTGFAVNQGQVGDTVICDYPVSTFGHF